MSQKYHIAETNPNDDVGGGGTICSGDVRDEDCAAPYIIFPHSSTDSNISPHVVLCSRCFAAIADGLDGHEEVIDAEVVEDDEPDIPVV